MIEFNEWASNGGLDVKKFPMSNIYKDTDTRVACGAWNHQQAKIDELQARIDEVVHILTYTNHASTPLCNELRDILKGNKYD